MFIFSCNAILTDVILGVEDAEEMEIKVPLCFYDVLADHFAFEPDERGKPILHLIVQLWSQPFASHIFALLFHKWVCQILYSKSQFLYNSFKLRVVVYSFISIL